MLPILDSDFYANDDTISYIIIAKYISNYFSLFTKDENKFDIPSNLNDSIWDLVMNETDPSFPIVNITTYQNPFYVNSTWENYSFRKSDLGTATSSDNSVVIIYSLSLDNRTNSLLNIIKTICLCILVIIATVYFESDVKTLILDPLEIMIEIVDKVAKDPIKAKNLENLEIGMKSTLSKLQKSQVDEIQNIKKDNNQKKNYKKSQDEYEVKIIQSAIKKISALLAIGFGEAGSEIIKENLSSYKDLDPLVKGKKKNLIFGFCDIRGFPHINEVLQENTVVFLNQIAEIVHSCVDLFHGSTNKNIGDAFLVVWEFPKVDTSKNQQLKIKTNNNLILVETKDTETLFNNFPNNKINNIVNNVNFKSESKNKLNNNVNTFRHQDSYQNKNMALKKHPSNIINCSPEITRVADSAVFAYLKIIAKINRDLRILSYRDNEKIKKKIKDFKVNLGFGLHTGWGIEGAIGSASKIDASYLSSNVNIAARLEAATRQYDVTILISGPLYDLLSEDVKNLCRLIDIVTVKGSIQPIKFYTIDINDNLKPSKKIKKDFSDKDVRYNHIVKKNKIKEEIDLAQIMIKKKYFKKMLRNARPKLFKILFNEAFDLYIEGDWESAKFKFEECLNTFEKDGPAKVLLNYIKEFNYQAPTDWLGYRALTSK